MTTPNSNPTMPFNLTPNDPAMKDVLDQVKRDIFLSMNCHHLGTIQKFNETKQTATVTINYKKTYIRRDAATGIYGPVLEDYPILLDCPVICLGGGSTALTFPISAGDECLVLFNDRDIDNWFKGGSGSSVASTALHSFGDGLILVGVRSLGHSLKSYDTTRARLYNGTTMVGVGPSRVKVDNGTYNLHSLLSTLVSDISTLNSTINTFMTTLSALAPPTNPVVVSMIQVPAAQVVLDTTPLIASLSAVSTGIGALLE